MPEAGLLYAAGAAAQPGFKEFFVGKYVLRGNSMYPFLKQMDICIAEDIPAERVSPGDVVVYSSFDEKGPIVHRVVGINPADKKLTLKGDNQEPAFSENVPFPGIIAKVIKVDRQGKIFNIAGRASFLRNRFTAFLSRHDLVPHRARKRFIDPLALRFLRARFFVSLRTFFYGPFDLLVSRRENVLRVHFMTGKKKGADIRLSRDAAGDLLMDSYIRMRDRNPFFILELLCRVAHAAEASFSCPVNIKVSDTVLAPYLEEANIRLANGTGSRYTLFS